MERATGHRSGGAVARQLLLQGLRGELAAALTTDKRDEERVAALEATARRTGRRIDKRLAQLEAIEVAQRFDTRQENVKCIGRALGRLAERGY